MDWGDVPAWLALVVSLVATARAWSAERRAREATAGAASVEVSLERIADLLERRPSRDDPVGTRSLRAPEALPGAGRADGPVPDFTVELLQGGRYRLRNVGAAAATGLTVSPAPPGRAVADLTEVARLPPLASTAPFRVAGPWSSPAPAGLLVRCDQLPDGVGVPLPPRHGRGG